MYPLSQRVLKLNLFEFILNNPIDSGGLLPKVTELAKSSHPRLILRLGIGVKFVPYRFRDKHA